MTEEIMKLAGRTAHMHLTSAIGNSNNLSITTIIMLLLYLNTTNLGHNFIITMKPTIFFFHVRSIYMKAHKGMYMCASD